MNHADIKKQARRTVHRQFAVPVLYTLKGQSTPLALEKSLTARIHNRVVTDPDGTGRGGAQILDDVTRVVFDREELALHGIVPAKDDRVTFPDYSMSVLLQTKDPYNGPIAEKWTVQQQQQRRV